MDTIGLDEAAALCRMHPNTLRERAARGDMPGAKPAREWVFIKDDLLAWLRGEYVEKAPCRSTSKKAVKSGGQTSAMLANGYAGLLAKQIELRRKSATTSSRSNSGPTSPPARATPGVRQ